MLRKLFIFCLPLLLAATAAVALAVDETRDLRDMQKEADLLDVEARQNQGQDTVFTSLSKQLNIPVDTLKAQQQSTNFGFGQLFIANSLASSSGKTFDQIAQEFKAGKGWGEIAKENNVNVGKIASNLKHANREVMKERAEQARGNKAAGSNAGGAERGAMSRGNPQPHGGQSAGPKGKR